MVTGETPDDSTDTTADGKDPAAFALERKGGLNGGAARAKNWPLSSGQRLIRRPLRLGGLLLEHVRLNSKKPIHECLIFFAVI